MIIFPWYLWVISIIAFICLFIGYCGPDVINIIEKILDKKKLKEKKMYMIIYWNKDDSSVFPFLNPRGLHDEGSIMLFETLNEADDLANAIEDTFPDRWRVISIEGVHE